MQLQGNKILITGATAGIGEALLHKFLSLGNQVIAVGRNREKLEKLAKSDQRIISFPCDLSKSEDLDRLTLFIEQHHRDLNILVNNAGIQYHYLFAGETNALDKIEHETSINFLAPLKIIALLVPIIETNPNAAIVNVSSGLGLVPNMQAPVYCGTKAGIHMFSKALRDQLRHIKVFEIIPSWVDTPMTAGRGKGKITPEQLADGFIKAFKKDKLEINIGKVKLLKILSRLSPA